jgi:hypothetical protein
MTADMVGFLVLLFPLVLLVFVLLMERVEQPMSRGSADEREIEHFLDDASREELNTFVNEGTDSALSRFRHRLRPRLLRRNHAVAAESPRS